MIGFATGALLIPGFIAFFTSRRGTARDPNRYAKHFVWLAIACILLSAMGSRSRTDNTRVKNLLAQAQVSGGWDDSTVEKFGTSLMRELLSMRSKYEAEVSHCSPKIAPVLTVESFSSRQNMQAAKAGLKECSDIDFSFQGQLDQLFKSVPSRVAATGWEDEAKAGFLRGFDSSSKTQLARLEHQNAVERMWVTATADLYEYAMEHSRFISVRNDSVLVSEPNVRKAFNQKLAEANRLYDNFQAIHGQIEDGRKHVMKENSLTEKDFELKK